MHFKELDIGTTLDMHLIFSNKNEVFYRLRVIENLGDSIELASVCDKILSLNDLFGITSIYLLFFSKKEKIYYIFKNPKISIKQNSYLFTMTKEGIIFNNLEKERYYGEIDCCYSNYNPCLVRIENIKKEDKIILKNISKKDCYVETNRQYKENEKIKFYIVDKDMNFISLISGKIKRIEKFDSKNEFIDVLKYGYGIVLDDRSFYLNSYIENLLEKNEGKKMKKKK